MQSDEIRHRDPPRTTTLDAPRADRRPDARPDDSGERPDLTPAQRRA
jgi:hypothetical protein